MKHLPKQITRFFSSGPSAATTADAPAMDGSEGRARYDARWDEALMACMFDLDAYRILDYWGPRWK